MASHKSGSPLAPLSSLPLPSTSNSSTLPLPKALRHNKSFLTLVNLLGLGTASTSASTRRSGSSSDATRIGGSDGSGAKQRVRGGDSERVPGEEEEEEDEDEGAEVDEESLMWDAQTALIAHQPALALQHYTIAALPPYRSSPSCLALGNLLTRGSGLAPSAEHRSNSIDKGKGKARAYSFGPAPTSPSMERRNFIGTVTSPTSPSPAISAVGRFMGFIWPSSPPPADLGPPPPPDRTYTDLVASGWTIPKEGKRAVRDVEGMGVAGGWYVLGLGWIVDGQLALPTASTGTNVVAKDAARAASDTSESIGTYADVEGEDDDALLIGPKIRSRIRRSPMIQPINPDLSAATTPALDTDGNGESSSEGTILKTPPFEEDLPAATMEDDAVTLKLIYDLLLPLLRLYRHGHIQSSDPVYLPPITFAQLPSSLRPQGDLQKRRNVWYLGSTVVQKLLGLDIMRAKDIGERKSLGARRRGVEVMARYILGMTSPPVESETQYRHILTIGHSGLEYPDELIRHAAKHLDIIRSPPASTPPLAPRGGARNSRKEYPFPVLEQPQQGQQLEASLLQAPRRSFTSPAKIRRTHKPQQASISSIKSNFSTRITETSLKSVASVASLSESRDGAVVADLMSASVGTKDGSGIGRCQAIDSLRRFQAQSAVDLTAATATEEEGAGDTWWPSLSGWSYTKAKEKLSSPDLDSPPSSPTRPGHAKEDSQRTIRAHPPPPLLTSNTPDSPKRDIAPSSTALTGIPTIRTVASTPTIGSLRHQPTVPSAAHLTPRPFDHIHSQSNINMTVDPVLAAAELASTLTKRVSCGVCSVQGLNFPECRRCGLVFCSRDCRVGSSKAGDGKRHVCGAWEGRRGLMPPAPYRAKGGEAGRVDVRQVLAC